jgi:hypothetical protein
MVIDELRLIKKHEKCLPQSKNALEVFLEPQEVPNGF